MAKIVVMKEVKSSEIRMFYKKNTHLKKNGNKADLPLYFIFERNLPLVLSCRVTELLFRSHGCETCLDLMTCATCQANFWLSTPSSLVCGTCSSIITGCQACDSTSVTAVCTQCNAAFQYALINGDCVECSPPQIVSLTGDDC
jgi:hypothetical protein